MKFPKIFICDVDGVMTNGQFFYDKKGKVMKIFGADDHDALLLLKKFIKILFISADKKGFGISKRRIVDDMNFKLFLVSSKDRLSWIKKRYDLSEIIYMADGIFDHAIMKKVRYSICPSDGFYLTKKNSDFVTKSKGGNRAVAEASIHILKKFFKKDIIS